MRRPFASVVIVVALGSAGCDAPPEPAATRPSSMAASVASAAAAVAAPATSKSTWASRRVTRDYDVMNTRIQLTTFTAERIDEAFILSAFDRAVDEIKRLDLLMTVWPRRDAAGKLLPDSELQTINAEAGKRPTKVGPETLEVVQKSVWMGARSGGLFDITFYAMHGLWKFDEDLEVKIPDKEAIEKARRLIDYRKIKIDPEGRTILLEQAGMKMNLGGIAKGYAVDAAARVLERQGLTSFFVQAGGDLYVRGRKPDGKAWRVGVRDPRGREGEFFAMIEVEDHAFSTAGDYERAFVKDGKRYHHIIDPRTGYPATASRSVTIWAKDAFTADAIDDAVFILGPEKGLELVDSIDDCGAVIVDANNKVWVSKRLKGRVEELRPPTDGT
jgi:FAD:protein FMN transferase